MKKSIFVFAGVALLALASCKKDYTCECTITDSSGLFPTTTSTATVTGKKKDVTTACENGSSTVSTITTTCKIK